MYCVLVFVLKFIWQTMACVCSRLGFQNLLNHECFKIVSIDFVWFSQVFGLIKNKRCVLHCMTCVLHPFSNLIFEIICSLRFAIPRPGIAGICIYIYAYIHIFLFDAGICTFIYIIPCGWGKGGEFLI